MRDHANYQVQTPVAFFIFRRPDTTQRVFDAIAQVKPTRLFVIADGARSPDEVQQCAVTRAIIQQVDWKCDVLTNFADVNLGLKRRIVSGLDWVFEQEEEAIILEDDCLPSPSFFPFCENMLQHYRHETKVMHISGDHFHAEAKIPESCYFSRYPHIWGWATWRRAWALYDVKMTQWQDPQYQTSILRKFRDRAEAVFWRKTWDMTYRNEINTWDYQWAFACIANDALSINPSVNLIANIGFGKAATHTTAVDQRLANLPVGNLNFPIIRPANLSRNSTLDTKTARLFFTQPTRLRRALRKTRGITRALMDRLKG